jgi:creatinine amidohydrolase
MRKLRLEELRWPEVKEALDAGFDTVVFAVGSTEQHGPHLPLATDTLIGDRLAEATARHLQRALIAPALRVGCSQHHLGFPGTISIDAATLGELIIGYCQTLARHGFRRIVILPSHGGNFQPVADTVERLHQELPEIKFVTFCDLIRLVAVSHERSARYGVSAGASGAHAGEYETSILLHLRPDLVDMQRAEEGFTGDFTPIIPDLLKHGLAKVTANGVLGDGRLGDARRGENYLQAWLELIFAEIEKP